MARVSPNQGGCWFCSEKDERPMMFSCEFDTYLHEGCLMKELQEKDYGSGMVAEANPEAVIMANEFNIKIK